MSILSFFWPQVLEKVESPISGEIKIIEQFGKRRLEIGGMTQSGGIVEKIWKRGIKKISNFSREAGSRSARQFPISNCLILGLGAGTAARVINSKLQTPRPLRVAKQGGRANSKLKLVGVEIDPEVIRLGKKYFGLGEIENLEIVVADAVNYVSRESGVRPAERDPASRESQESGAGRFDLILVDLYQGREIPKRCQTKRFLEGLRGLPAGRQGIKRKRGMVVFNRLYSRDERKETDEFVQKCREVFGEVETKKAVCNLMVFCR